MTTPSHYKAAAVILKEAAEIASAIADGREVHNAFFGIFSGEPETVKVEKADLERHIKAVFTLID